MGYTWCHPSFPPFCVGYFQYGHCCSTPSGTTLIRKLVMALHLIRGSNFRHCQLFDSEPRFCCCCHVSGGGVTGHPIFLWAWILCKTKQWNKNRIKQGTSGSWDKVWAFCQRLFWNYFGTDRFLSGCESYFLGRNQTTLAKDFWKYIFSKSKRFFWPLWNMCLAVVLPTTWVQQANLESVFAPLLQNDAIFWEFLTVWYLSKIFKNFDDIIH